MVARLVLCFRGVDGSRVDVPARLLLRNYRGSRAAWGEQPIAARCSTSAAHSPATELSWGRVAGGVWSFCWAPRLALRVGRRACDSVSSLHGQSPLGPHLLVWDPSPKRLRRLFESRDRSFSARNCGASVAFRDWSCRSDCHHVMERGSDHSARGSLPVYGQVRHFAFERRGLQ